MAVVPPIKVPLVVDAERLVQVLHEILDDGAGKCEHTDGSIISFKSCEIMAQAVIDAGGFQTSAEMIEALKDNSGVQEVITNAMASAWQEGHDECCIYGDKCIVHTNTYTVEP